MHKNHSVFTIYTLHDQQKDSPVEEFEHSRQGTYRLWSIFRLERYASDIELFLDTMTRLAENSIFQRVCIKMRQTFMVGFGSLGIRVSILCRKSFPQLLLHSSPIQLKLFECEVQYHSPQESMVMWNSLLSTITIIIAIIMIIFLFTIILQLLKSKGLQNLALL
jgi:hypothetical protein